MMGHAGTLSHAETVDNLMVFAKEVLPRLKTYRQPTLDAIAQRNSATVRKLASRGSIASMQLEHSVSENNASRAGLCLRLDDCSSSVSVARFAQIRRANSRLSWHWLKPSD
jgi:hypothetical protein